MPVVKKKAPVKAEPVPEAIETTAPQQEQETRPVIYDKVDPSICDLESAITHEVMRQILGWETEDEYAARRMAEDPALTREECRFEEGDYYLDWYENKVRMWNNNHNRPLTRAKGLEYAQTFLNREWAGPLTMPGETVNGEPFIISRTGNVLSGQHRGFGLIIAYQRWSSEKEKYRWKEKWPDGPPVLETLLITGISDNVRVIQTIDNVLARTLTDVMYVAGIFAHDNPPKNRNEQRECSRMLDYCLSLLWERTGAGKDAGATYQTHGASANFLERHPRILDCIRHLFEENKNRGISSAKLSPGQCAAMLYLMASAESDGDLYHNADPPIEKLLQWGLWDEAKQFWVDFAKDEENSRGREIRKAIGWLADEDDPGKSGRLVEKMCVIAKAWSLCQSPAEVTFEEIDPQSMYEIKDGVNHLVEFPGFGGIDVGPPQKKKPKEEKAPKPEEIEVNKLLERQRRAEEQAAKIKAQLAAKAAAKAGTSPAPTKPSTNGATKPLSRSQIEKKNTEAAAKADAELAAASKAAVSNAKPAKPSLIKRPVPIKKQGD